eukprot:769854-Amphidinium_carterae.1
MTCKKCGRYVTSHKGTWRNLGTIAKQPCKPTARRQKGRAGKAAHKQSGGARPALPPGTRPRGRAPGPSKKPKIHDAKEPAASLFQDALNSEVQRELGQRPSASEDGREEEPGGSSTDHELRQCELCNVRFPVPLLQDRVIRDQ